MPRFLDGTVVRNTRMENSISLAQLAKTASISHGTLSDIETGKNGTTPLTASKIMLALTKLTTTK